MNAPEHIEEPEDRPADIRLAPRWVFDLGVSDSLLVLKALGGRLDPRGRSGNEVEQAKALGDKLTALRAHHGRRLLSALQRAEDRMHEAKA
jgi:hypothetical protein